MVKIGCITLVRFHDRFIGIRCKKGRGVILPGGKWEPGETFVQAAQREFREETGMAVERLQLVFSGMSEEGYYTYAFLGFLSGRFVLGAGDEAVVLTGWPELKKSSFGGYYELLEQAVEPYFEMGNI